MNSLNRDWEEFEKLLYTYFRCGECEVASEKQGKEVFCVNCQWDKEQLCDKFSQAILSAKEEAKAESYKEGFNHGWESRSHKISKDEERELTKNIIDYAISAISNKTKE